MELLRDFMDFIVSSPNSCFFVFPLTFIMGFLIMYRRKYFYTHPLKYNTEIILSFVEFLNITNCTYLLTCYLTLFNLFALDAIKILIKNNNGNIENEINSSNGNSNSFSNSNARKNDEYRQ